jgi:hypothetical protein
MRIAPPLTVKDGARPARTGYRGGGGGLSEGAAFLATQE